MRFVLALVRTLGLLLSFCLLCAFLYFTFINQQNIENAKLLSYGSLLLFALSIVITSMVSVGFESYQGKKQVAVVIKKINDKLQEIAVSPKAKDKSAQDTVKIDIEEIIKPLSEKMTKEISDTKEQLSTNFDKLNRLVSELKLGDSAGKNISKTLEDLNSQISEMQEGPSVRVNQILSSFSNLYSQFSTVVDSVKTSTDGADEIFPKLKESFDKFDSQKDVVNNISTNVDDLREQQQRLDAKVEDIALKISEILPMIQKTLQDNNNNIAVSSSIRERSAPTSSEFIADEKDKIEDEIINDKTGNNTSIESISENNDEEIPAEGNIEETIADTEEAPTINDVSKVTDNEDEINENTVVVDVEEHEKNTSQDDAVDIPEFVADDPYGKPAERNISELLPEINTTTNPDVYSSDIPFGDKENSGTTDDMPDLPPPTDLKTLQSEDPFGVPSDEETVEAPVANDELKAEDPFGANVTQNSQASETEEIELDSIFNEKLASELAELDILNDNNAEKEN